jgi:hypothetical protein
VRRVRKKARYETCARMEMRAKVVIEESWGVWKTDGTVEARNRDADEGIT